MADVFISYAREDIHAAQALAHLLESRGWSVWWDRRLVAGSEFSPVIQSQLNGAQAVVVVWSKHSSTSKWVRAEADAADQRGVLVPIRLDQSPVPLPFNTLHTIDLAPWVATKAPEPARQLVEAVATHAGQPQRLVFTSSSLPPPPSQSPSGPPSPAQPPPRRPVHRHRALAGIAIGALILLLALAYVRFRSDGPGPGPTTEPTGSPPPVTPTPTPQPSPARPLRQGTEGNDVKELQTKLQAAGFGPDSADGRFGKNTEAALRAFEWTHASTPGVTADGSITTGGDEWAVLVGLPKFDCRKWYVQGGAVATPELAATQQMLTRVQSVVNRSSLPLTIRLVNGNTCSGLSNANTFLLAGPVGADGFDSDGLARSACTQLRAAEQQALSADSAEFGWVNPDQLARYRDPESAHPLACP